MIGLPDLFPMFGLVSVIVIRIQTIEASSIGSLSLQRRGGTAWLVGQVAMPEAECEKLTHDMREVLSSMSSKMLRLGTYDMRHPGRGDPLFKSLGLEETFQKTLPYFEARDAAVAVAEGTIPKIKSFILGMMNDEYLHLSAMIKSKADSHSLSLADRPAISYVIKSKYEALQEAFRQVLSNIGEGPTISTNRIMQSISKKPVDSNGRDALAEGMQNFHIVDEYRVVCSITEQFADHANKISSHININIPELVARVESIEIPADGLEL